MSGQYGQYRGGAAWRGFGPFSQRESDQHMRVSDAERQEVADRLAEHFTAGRLDQAEFDERLGRAMSAKTRADLGGLFEDLPEAGAAPRPQATGAPGAPGPWAMAPRRRHPALGLVLAVVIILVAAHAVAQVAVPWLWFGFLIAAVLFATRAVRRSHAGHGGHAGHAGAGRGS